MRSLAPVSLLLACVLFAVTLPFADGFWIGLLHAFAEAAMIGGLADWFAVVALFRHPFGLPVPHTAILLKYRARLTQSLSDAVQNSWLSKQAILARLEGWDLAGLLVHAARDPINREALLSAMRVAMREVTASLRPEAAARAALSFAGERIKPDDLARFATAAGRQVLAFGWDGKAFAFAAAGAAEWLAEDRVKIMVAENLRSTMEDYSASPLRRFGKWMAEKSNVLNYDDLAASLLASVREDLSAISQHEDHPARASFSAWFTSFVDGLPANESIAAFLEASSTEALRSDAAAHAIAEVLKRLQDWLIDDLARDDSRLMQHAAAWTDDGLARLAADVDMMHTLDAWLKERIARAVEAHHGEIGAIVRHNLDALDDKQLVAEIESRVGPDLQYIRLNGAVVGGLVGALLFLLKSFL